MDNKRRVIWTPFVAKRAPKNRSSQSGGALLTVLIYFGVAFVVSTGILQVIKNSTEHERIIRAKTRISILQVKIENSASSMISMMETAKDQANNALLYRCLVQKNCVANDGSPAPYTLYDASGQVVSGFRNINGARCDGTKKSSNCPVNIITSLEILCSGNTLSCTKPSNIRTTYSITAMPKAFNGRTIKGVEKGQANLALFACPLDPKTQKPQYVTGIHVPTEQPFCAPARYSPYSVECSSGLASFGISSDHRLLCSNVRNYCKNNFANVFVLDRSSSMTSRSSMTYAKTAALEFLELSRNSDNLGLVSFGTSANIESKLVADKHSMRKRIDSIAPSGMTNMEDALNRAEEVLATAPEGKLKTIIFLSDGLVTAGGDPLPVAERLKANGVQIFAIGVGRQVDQNVLRNLASSASDYFYAPTEKDIGNAMNLISKAACLGSESPKP